MARKKIVSDFYPDFTRIKKYERKYINLPFDTVNNSDFFSLASCVHTLYLTLGVLSFTSADKDGWFPATMKELVEKSKLSINSVRFAKKVLEEKKFIDVGIAFHKNSNIHFSDCYRINGFKDMSVTENNEG